MLSYYLRAYKLCIYNIIIIMHIYHTLINALSGDMIHVY